MSESSHSTLSDPFQKARRQLVLFGGLLFAWSFIGIDLPEGKLPVVDIVIKSPQAIPWVLIGCTVYFLGRISIEWFQCDPTVRERLASRIDLGVSAGIAFSAIALYFGQVALGTQLANLLSPWSLLLILILPVAYILGMSVPLLFRRVEMRIAPSMLFSSVILMVFAASATAIVKYADPVLNWSLFTLAPLAFVAGCVSEIAPLWSKRQDAVKLLDRIEEIVDQFDLPEGSTATDIHWTLFAIPKVQRDIHKLAIRFGLRKRARGLRRKVQVIARRIHKHDAR